MKDYWAEEDTCKPAEKSVRLISQLYIPNLVGQKTNGVCQSPMAAVTKD